MLEAFLPPIEYATSTYARASACLDDRFFVAAWLDPPVDPIAEAVRAAGADARVTERTRAAASILLGLVSGLPNPEIVVEPEGEISFEWYKDRHHLLVLSVDGQHIRWAGMIGPDEPISGVQLFVGAVPFEALNAIGAAI